MKKIYFHLLIVLSFLFFPVLALADGGMIVWPPIIHLDQSAQNAIVAWNGSEETIMLSIDMESTADVTALRIIPLPANPSEIKEGSFESFEKLVELMNEKMVLPPAYREAGASPPGIEITFQKIIGAHDLTVVKVNDLAYFLNWVKDFANSKGFQQKEISSEFKEGIANYLKKDIKYFVFDVIEAGQEKESIKPLIYNFESKFLYYPIIISGISEISESRAAINLFLITKKEVEFTNVPYSYYRDYYWFKTYGYPVELTKTELAEVSQEIADLFEGDVQVRQASIYARLNDLKRDLMLFPDYLWDKNITLGFRGEEIKALQQILMNEGLCDAEVGATGYFGPITKAALAKFQEKYSQDILQPLNMEAGTGYFESKTKDYFKKLSLSVGEEEKEEFFFSRYLSLGMTGNDVKALQEILIKEGVWGRTDIGATGYFGPITKAAVIRYQEKYASEILEPLGLTNGTGFVGPSTLAYLKNK